MFLNLPILQVQNLQHQYLCLSWYKSQFALIRLFCKFFLCSRQKEVPFCVQQLRCGIGDINVSQDDIYAVCKSTEYLKKYYHEINAIRQFCLAYHFMHVDFIVGTTIPVFHHQFQSFVEFSVDDLVRRLSYRSQKRSFSSS